jgi:Paraquat-inducible protein A
VGGVVTPMIEVEAKISRLGMTFLGQPIAFTDQLLYFQSKSVLEVFHTLISMGRPDMYIVGVLVLTFSVIFPTLKIFTLSLCLYKPVLLRRSRLARFFALESSKWSMADVMALAIFMSFVAFNGLVANSMAGLRQTGAELVIPTDSSKILAGYPLFIGFCLASLFLSKKLERGIRAAQATEPR